MTRSSTARWRFIDQLGSTGQVIALFFYNLVANANAASLTAFWWFRTRAERQALLDISELLGLKVQVGTQKTRGVTSKWRNDLSRKILWDNPKRLYGI